MCIISTLEGPIPLDVIPSWLLLTSVFTLARWQIMKVEMRWRSSQLIRPFLFNFSFFLSFHYSFFCVCEFFSPLFSFASQRKIEKRNLRANAFIWLWSQVRYCMFSYLDFQEKKKLLFHEELSTSLKWSEVLVLSICCHGWKWHNLANQNATARCHSTPW